MSTVYKKTICAEDVSSWLGYTEQHEAGFPLVPGWVEFARKELGQRVANLPRIAEFFTRRLFIDLCCGVTDAYLEAATPDDLIGGTYGDAKSVRMQLNSVAENAAQMIESLERLDKSGLALLGSNYRDGPKRQREWRFDIGDFKALLDALKNDAAAGATAAGVMVKSGAAKAPLTHLILNIAAVLRKNDLSADAKSSGPLHALCDLVLGVPAYKDAFGEPASLRDSIRSVLKQAESETSRPLFAAMFRA